MSIPKEIIDSSMSYVSNYFVSEKYANSENYSSYSILDAINKNNLYNKEYEEAKRNKESMESYLRTKLKEIRNIIIFIADNHTDIKYGSYKTHSWFQENVHDFILKGVFYGLINYEYSWKSALENHENLLQKLKESVKDGT